MIKENKLCFTLDTKRTSYLFHVNEYGHLEHLYYGSKIQDLIGFNLPSSRQKWSILPGNVLAYNDQHLNYSLEALPQEVSFENSSDLRRPFIKIANTNSSVFDFKYQSHTIRPNQNDEDLIAQSHGNKDDIQLNIQLLDDYHQIELELIYRVYTNSDVITRYSKVRNRSDQSITLKNLMSLQLDLPHHAFILDRFDGHWIREMEKHSHFIQHGTTIIESRYGTSSNRHQPFFMIKAQDTNELHGECYGFNSVYSGNHYASIEVNSYDQTRVLIGHHPDFTHIELNPGESFTGYEAVMTYSKDGLHQLSLQMHTFVKEHILPNSHLQKRPLLVNSWESFYFDVTQKKIIQFAKKAKQLGFELIVLDDGWFGHRNDDTTSLGDYHLNHKKFKNLKSLIKQVHKMDLMFGIWVEPEMISIDSDLYREHPEYALMSDRKQAIGRQQYFLDLTQEAVVHYIIKQLDQLLENPIDYIKWDMNRLFSEQYSKKYETTDNYSIYYIQNLYRILNHLKTNYPNLIIETCASGGNRFDLGMLCFSHQIWASDNTDAYQRRMMQKNYSYGYPQITYTSHVSSKINHQTLRPMAFENRLNVALSANMGYELNLLDLNKREMNQVIESIQFYKEFRHIILNGVYHRIEHHRYKNDICIVSQDKKMALYFHYAHLTRPNDAFTIIKPTGLCPNRVYHICNKPKKVSIKIFGDLVNQVTPFHIKQDSMMHHIIDRLKSFKQESVDYIIQGDQLMQAGIVLNQTYPSVAYDESIRIMLDFDTRIYVISEVIIN